MKTSNNHTAPATALLAACLILVAATARADDIDIFLGNSAGEAKAPNVIFLIDNSPNWSRAAQHWPDNGGNQGEAELQAIINLLNSWDPDTHLNIGVAMLSEYAGSSADGATPGDGGGYIRFGARDVADATNRAALVSMLTSIKANINSPAEKISGMANKDESAAFYEIYKYYGGLTPYTGPYANNPKADVSGNTNTATAAQLGLTDGFAIGASGDYQSVLNVDNSCARNFIIYVANNANNTGSAGRSSYQSSIADVAPALPNPSGGLVAWTDEWTSFLYSDGVPVPGDPTHTRSIVTYVLDAYNAQQKVAYSILLQNAAKVGGGKYFQVGSEDDIAAALSTILTEIQAVNSTFASAALPVSATNRSENKNQVFIPLFRPDQDANPRWVGNLKQYQLILSGGTDVDLGDANGDSAINPLTGYPTECAVSFWTSSSDAYWNFTPWSPVAKSVCGTLDPSVDSQVYNDSPDGPFVEKGGVAEVLRKGNDPAASADYQVHRTVYTKNMVAFNAANTGLSAGVVDYTLGVDINDENSNTDTGDTRPTIHGDVIHSRPLPVDYGDATGVTVYYGSNDGSLRAVNTDDGSERWAYVAEEHYSKLSRLMDNTPVVLYPGAATGTAKDYFFDGSIGLYQNADNSKVWIFPSMRRGGRMIYGFDVTDPASPVFKWKVGCPNLADNTGCTSGMSDIGQTWSIPLVAFIKGYSSGAEPVIITGGGYDSCEDSDTSAPACGSATGNHVYVIDAATGGIIKTLDTDRSVPSDVAVIDMDLDGMVDAAYAADTGGNVYRIDFTDGPGSDYTARAAADWTIHKVAHTAGAGRKFLFAPALLRANSSKAYVAIGSGDREHPLEIQYPYSSVTNRFYVYLDDLAATADNNMDDTASFYDFTSDTTCSTTGVTPSSAMKGWFMNLNANGTGEQTVTSGLIASGMVTFSTNRPIAAEAGSCTNVLGEARGYWVNLFNASGGIASDDSCGGDRSTTFVGGGLPPSPVFGTVTISSGGVDRTVTVILGAADLEGGASSTIAPQKPKLNIKTKRTKLFWKFSGDK